MSNESFGPDRIVDGTPADEAYFNAWVATRFAVVWMDLLFDETQRDVDLAIS